MDTDDNPYQAPLEEGGGRGGRMNLTRLAWGAGVLCVFLLAVFAVLLIRVLRTHGKAPLLRDPSSVMSPHPASELPLP